MSPPDPNLLSDLPEPSLRPPRRWTVSVIWVVPLIAAIAAGVLGVRSYLSSGPSIVIDFKTAEGIESGKTEVRYKEVPIGKPIANTQCYVVDSKRELAEKVIAGRSEDWLGDLDLGLSRRRTDDAPREPGDRGGTAHAEPPASAPRACG